MRKWTFLILIVVAIGATAAVDDGGCKKACRSGKCVAKGDGVEICECTLPHYGDNCQKGGLTTAIYVFGGICAVSLVTTIILQIVNCIWKEEDDEDEEIEMATTTETEGKSLPEASSGTSEKQVYKNLELPEHRLYEEVKHDVVITVKGGGDGAAAKPPLPSAPAPPPVGLVAEDGCYIDLQHGQEAHVYEEFKK